MYRQLKSVQSTINLLPDEEAIGACVGVNLIACKQDLRKQYENKLSLVEHKIIERFNCILLRVSADLKDRIEGLRRPVNEFGDVALYNDLYNNAVDTLVELDNRICEIKKVRKDISW